MSLLHQEGVCACAQAQDRGGQGDGGLDLPRKLPKVSAGLSLLEVLAFYAERGRSQGDQSLLLGKDGWVWPCFPVPAQRLGL